MFFGEDVLHSERSSAIPTTGALARGPGTNHVARDLVFERPIRYSDTSPWGGLVVGTGRVAEVVRGHGGPLPKSLDSDENFEPEHMLFFCELRFVVIYALFGDLWANKPLFGSKTVFLGQEVHYYMVYIAYFTELILQICNFAQKGCI